jgi:bifunctional non-homologous end joining protein LigD
MPASKDRPTSTLQRKLEAVNASVHDSALAILPYIPARRRAAPPRPRDITLPAGFISPSLPMTAFAAPSGELWLHEIKLDGLRVIARNDGQRVRLYSRSGEDLSERYPLIVEAMARLPYCTIDGEAVACDENGIASFDLLQSGQRDDQVVFCAFDLIEQAGRDRRRDPLARRKADLDALVANAGRGVLAITWVDGGERDGPALFQQACSLGHEGIVSKRKDSRYMSGRSPYWLKVSNPASDAARRDSKHDRDSEEV